MPAPQGSQGEVLNRKIADGGEVAKECGELEEAIASLRMSYEQYFLGIDRKPPTTEHNELKRRMQKLRGGFIRQTALRFRIQSIQAKFTTYERLWSRTMLEIENGTYRRDLFKAKLHAQERAAKEAEKAGEKAAERAARAERTQIEKVPQPPVPGAASAPPKAAAPKAAAAPSPPRGTAAPPPTADGGLGDALSDAKLKTVFNAYLTAKKRCQEDVSKLSYEQVAANLRKQVPDLVKKAGAQGVEFKIVIKDGKAILRAVPK
ncbi:MAG TPA: MXAN_5187 C-terminal domain-containing protein [Myxococcaceae bacterium]|nr:MXAN_5187 C-terminal domain-containing protein [Myxococcaceae bacterium]